MSLASTRTGGVNKKRLRSDTDSPTLMPAPKKGRQHNTDPAVGTSKVTKADTEKRLVDNDEASDSENEDVTGSSDRIKHWTEDERTQCYTWILGSNEHWAIFQTSRTIALRQVRPVQAPMKCSLFQSI